DSRFNLDVKYQSTAALTESDRGIMSAQTGRPFDLTGNVGPMTPSGTIDPALDAAAGGPVSVAGVPASAAHGAPSLADFLPTANRPNITDISPYRTLTPSTHDLTVNSVLARPLSQRITATLNGTLDLSSSDTLRGLPGATLALPSTDPFSPFS